MRGVLNDKRMPMKFKAKIYKTAVTPIMKYEPSAGH